MNSLNEILVAIEYIQGLFKFEAENIQAYEVSTGILDEIGADDDLFTRQDVLAFFRVMTTMPSQYADRKYATGTEMSMVMYLIANWLDSEDDVLAVQIQDACGATAHDWSDAHAIAFAYEFFSRAKLFGTTD